MMRMTRFQKKNDMTGEKQIFYINAEKVTDVYTRDDQTRIRLINDCTRTTDEDIENVIHKLRGEAL